MKILIISHEYPPIGGGGANACMKLSEEYVKQGHEVTIVTVWFQGLEKEIKSPGFRIIRVPSKRQKKEHCSFGEMLDYLMKAWRVCDRVERENQFDICQVFFAIPSGPIGLYLKWRYKLPYIIRFGGGDIPGFQERFQAVYKLIGPFEKIIWKYADALVANSSGLKKMAENFYAKKKILVIPNGADVQAVNAQIKDKRQDESYRILFVSRLIERKGLQYLIPQLKEIERECKKKVILTVVGDGPYRQELEKIVKEHTVGHLVEFVGQKEKKELPEYYENADVFVLPSKKEGMPNVVLEAMSFGLPIVMTPCEGSEELIRDNGYAVDVEVFAEKIIFLERNDGYREKIGNASLDMVKCFFQWSYVAKKYEQLIKEITES